MIKDEDRKRLTGVYTAPEKSWGKNCRIQWTAQLHKIGTQEAYFSITADVWEPLVRGKRDVGGGCVHDELNAVPLTGDDAKLPALVKWHLCSVKDGPMYYIENSLFHLKEGKVDYFKSCCAFGALEDDVLPWETEQAKEYIARHANPDAAVAEVSKKWLEDRRPRVMAAFEAAMVDYFGEEARA